MLVMWTFLRIFWFSGSLLLSWRPRLHFSSLLPSYILGPSVFLCLSCYWKAAVFPAWWAWLATVWVLGTCTAISLLLSVSPSIYVHLSMRCLWPEILALFRSFLPLLLGPVPPRLRRARYRMSSCKCLSGPFQSATLAFSMLHWILSDSSIVLTHSSIWKYLFVHQCFSWLPWLPSSRRWWGKVRGHCSETSLISLIQGTDTCCYSDVHTRRYYGSQILS